jgi:hypothetical protein
MLCFLFPRDSLMPAVSGSMVSEGYTWLVDKLTTIARTVSDGLGIAEPDTSLEGDRVQTISARLLQFFVGVNRQETCGT